ncbi:sensor histidine kinase [Roseiterribacter gracilis]|uniref:histidine kinase n=1 Tax=Roseiterribacter gracilis TaxID=2812848 RepID=A0A8S8XCM2_9PROT|nr:hypothetical protein TMPK1_39850 [Rhodospirillales bacterium TMPK1]
MMRFLLSACVAVLLLFAAPDAAFAQRVTPTDSTAVELGSATWVLRDPAGTLDLGAARAAWREGRFTAPAGAVPRHHAGDGASWLRIELDLQNDPGRGERWIEFEAIRPRVVELYVLDRNDESKPLLTYRGGLEITGSAPDRLFATPIGTVGATDLVLYGRMVADFTPELRTRLVTERDAVARERRLERYLGPLEGGVIGLSILLLALWIGARDRMLLSGAGLVTSCLVVVHVLMGQDRKIWPSVLQPASINEPLFLLAIGALMCGGLRFSNSWLGTNRYAPRLSRVLRVVSIIVPIAFVLVPLFAPRSKLLLLTVLVGSSMFLLAAAIFRAAIARAQGTWLFIAFGVPMLVAALVRIMSANGLLPWSEGMPYMSFITMIALALGITFGLADASRRRLQAMVDLRTRQLADANDSLRALSDGRNRLLGVVAHDVRAPLASMVTAAEMLRVGQLDSKDAPPLLDLVAANGRATLVMLEDLLDLAAIESGTIPVDLRSTDILSVAQERAHLLRPLLGTRAVQIDGAPLQAMADKVRLGQALDNLLSNAIKFSPAGAPISLTVHRDNGFAMIDVADRGTGLTDIELQRLFAPFSPGIRQPEIGRSTGLGLAIVKRLVELQSGRVEAHPRPDGGTIFRILLKPS